MREGESRKSKKWSRSKRIGREFYNENNKTREEDKLSSNKENKGNNKIVFEGKTREKLKRQESNVKNNKDSNNSVKDKKRDYRNKKKGNKNSKGRQSKEREKNKIEDLRKKRNKKNKDS